MSELVAHACLDLFGRVVCGESAATTSIEHLQYLMPMLTDHTLFLSLFALNNDPIATLATTLLREIITKAPANFVEQMRRQVLSDGTALVHFRSSLFSLDTDVRAQSRFMLSLWMDGKSSTSQYTLRSEYACVLYHWYCEIKLFFSLFSFFSFLYFSIRTPTGHVSAASNIAANVGGFGGCTHTHWGSEK